MPGLVSFIAPNSPVDYEPSMGSLARSALLLAALLCASCQRPAGSAGESLVGAKKLPAEQQLSRETIEIVPASWDAPEAPHVYFDLRPDDSLTVTLSHWAEKAHSEVIDGRDTFHLSPADASKARRRLWQLRPQELTGVESITRPTDCPPPPTDTFPDYSVAFIAEGPKPGVKDDLIGITDVPAARFCAGKSAAEARQLIQQVLDLFPKSKVAAEFESRKAAG
jgi:hypothetical protein